MNILVPIPASFVAFIFSFALDYALYSLRRLAAQSPSLASFRLGGVVIDLLFVALILFSAWLIAKGGRTPRWLGLFIAIVALFVLFGLSVVSISSTPLGRAFRSPLTADPSSFVYLQTGAIFISGLLALLRPATPSAPGATQAA
jgi:hypothetical protein